MPMGSVKKVGAAMLCVLTVAAAGCGPRDEVVQRQPGPTVDVKKVDPKDIKPVPQAPKFTGTPREVASAMDEVVEAFFTADGEFLCSKAYRQQDLDILNKDDVCAKSFEKFFKAFDGYQMTITEIRVSGDEATVKAKALTNDLSKPGKALLQPLTFTLVKEDGEWRMNINAARTLELQQQSTGATN